MELFEEDGPRAIKNQDVRIMLTCTSLGNIDSLTTKGCSMSAPRWYLKPSAIFPSELLVVDLNNFVQHLYPYNISSFPATHPSYDRSAFLSSHSVSHPPLLRSASSFLEMVVGI